MVDEKVTNKIETSACQTHERNQSRYVQEDKHHVRGDQNKTNVLGDSEGETV